MDTKDIRQSMINESLKLPKELPKPKEVFKKRLITINKSILLETGTRENPIEHNILNFKDYNLSVLKPGKETFETGTKNNPYDAPPIIRFKGEKLNFDPSFRFIIESIYKDFDNLSENNM